MRTYFPGDEVEILYNVEGFKSARLCRRYCSIPLNAAPNGSVVKLPEGLEKGTWNIIVETDCGCFSKRIHVNCHPVALSNINSGTNIRPVERVC